MTIARHLPCLISRAFTVFPSCTHARARSLTLSLSLSQEIKTIFGSISKLYSHHPEFHRIKKTDFHMTPRCTSALGNKCGEWLDIYGDGSYRLKYPQVQHALLIGSRFDLDFRCLTLHNLLYFLL